MSVFTTPSVIHRTKRGENMNTNNWLDQAKENGQSIVVKTVEGRQVRGQLSWYDKFNICLENHGGEEVNKT